MALRPPGWPSDPFCWPLRLLQLALIKNCKRWTDRQQKLKRPERQLCVYFTMEILRNLWTHWDTKDFARKLPPAWLMFSLMFSHLLLLHQNFIVSGYSTRFVNGKAVSCYQMNGVGRKLTRAGHQFQQMCLQPQKNFSKSSGATVIPTVVVKDAVARSMVWSAL